MINALQLYGALIFTLIGFIIPILTILISIFPQGIKSLSLKYENERKQSEDNIANEILKKKQTDKNWDYKALRKTLVVLKRRRVDAAFKLRLLEPLKLFLITVCPFAVSFIGVLFALFGLSNIATIVVLMFSLLAFVCGIIILMKSILVLFEIGEIINQARNTNENKVIELLSLIVEKIGDDNLFLKPDEMQVQFYNETVIPGKVYLFTANKEYNIPVSIINSSDRIAKNIEVCFRFPKEFLVNETPNISSIYSDKKGQNVRFNQEIIQAKENNHQNNLIITFLKVGEHKLNMFIKGESIKYRKVEYTIKVIE
ncbi:MAG: hypothetical protein NTV81_03650 [Candidatus Komeilibacteria bacterium]|nr:hypothetical protein [Candidatus Komeilibacteria bacterium]